MMLDAGKKISVVGVSDLTYKLNNAGPKTPVGPVSPGVPGAL